MNAGTIPVADLSGGFDLRATLESGQTFLWLRDDGRAYEGTDPTDGSAWYYTVTDGEVVRVRQRDVLLEWEATFDADRLLVGRLRLDDDLPAIFEAIPDDPLLAEARDAYSGLRLVDDPFFPCLVSFICSAQMRVERIHGMCTRLAEQYGDSVTFDGDTYFAFPTPDQLAAATEADLRDLSLGYRAPYVQRTAEMVADGEAAPAAAREYEYEDAREYLTQFVGVGDKVADCILLFSLDFLEAVPLDTWIQTAIEDYYPDCDGSDYAETSRRIRRQFGDRYAGYAQTYVFFYLRTGGE